MACGCQAILLIEDVMMMTLTPKTVREMTQLLRETQKDGDTQTNQRNTNEYTK